MTSALIFRSLAEDRADGLEGALQDEAEEEEDEEGHQRHLHVEVDEIAEGEERGEDAAEEVDDAGADEVADAFDVGHDAGDEGAGAVLVVERDGEAADVGLHLGAQLGDETLAGLREHLGEGEGGDALDDGRRDDHADDDRQQAHLVLRHDVVDEIAGRGGKDETAGAVEQHEYEAAGEQPAARLDQLPDVGEDLAELRLGTRRREAGRGGAAGAATGPVSRGKLGSTEVGGVEGGHGLLSEYGFGARLTPGACGAPR